VAKRKKELKSQGRSVGAKKRTRKNCLNFILRGTDGSIRGDNVRRGKGRGCRKVPYPLQIIAKENKEKAGEHGKNHARSPSER